MVVAVLAYLEAALSSVPASKLALTVASLYAGADHHLAQTSGTCV